MAILNSMEDSMVCFWDHFFLSSAYFLLQESNDQSNEDQDPGITIIFSSDADIDTCLGMPSVGNIGLPPFQNLPTLARGRH